MKSPTFRQASNRPEQRRGIRRDVNLPVDFSAPQNAFMKCLGLIGGLTAPNLSAYWYTIIREVQQRFGTRETPRFLICNDGDSRWMFPAEAVDDRRLKDELIENGRRLALAGAEGLVICSAALNSNASDLQRVLKIPVIDLGYALTHKLRSLHLHHVAILGIRSAQEEAMWRKCLTEVEISLPSPEDQEWLVQCIQAATIGHPVAVEWKVETNRIVSQQRRLGAEALILADPALGQWIKPGETLLYPLDSAEIHASTAAHWAIDAKLLPAPGCVICR